MIPAAYTKEELAAKFREAAALVAARGFGWGYALNRLGVDLAACEWFGHVFSSPPGGYTEMWPAWTTSKDRATALALAAYLIELDEEFE